MNKEEIKNKKIIIFINILIIVLIGICTNVYASDSKDLKNATRAYFSAEVTKGYGNGDCILLENYDQEGNKRYGLIDTGRKINKKDQNGNDSTVVKEFLKDHGVSKLEFLIITHQHGDHNGDALTVLENFEVGTIYMKEFDLAWSPNGTQPRYEEIIKLAIEKNIKVVGVSYLSLNSDEISPSRSDSFKESVKNARKELFEGFNNTNIRFEFGSSQIQMYNWELFCEDGTQYITGETKDKKREVTSLNENNNSLALLLTQGNKKAFFSGDMNNLDKNETAGRIGDEDRIKDDVGNVDFLKLGHHGTQNSNTREYINVLKPEYAIITNNVGSAYKEIMDWIDKNNVEYLYSTTDKYGVTATFTENEVYLGLETTKTITNINGNLYYIPEGSEYKNYKENVYELEYESIIARAFSWDELKNYIDKNKTANNFKIEDENKKCRLTALVIDLKNNGDWTANSTIELEKHQLITIKTSDEINILRGTSLIEKPLFYVEGKLILGKQNMNGKLVLDGNKNNVEASSTLIRIENGRLDIYDNIKLCNNINKTNKLTAGGTTQNYTSYGSGISAKSSIINMYGGEIVNNSQDVIYNATLPKLMKNAYSYGVTGSGIYLTNSSKLNMYGGKISNNEAQNNSQVTTDSDYSKYFYNRTLTQNCQGVGISATGNSVINLLGGEISGNIAKNNAKTTIRKGENETEKTILYQISDCIYGVGIYANWSKLNISNNFIISNNSAENNSVITIEEDTKIQNSATAAIRGLQVYTSGADVMINGTEISNGKYINNVSITNNGAIGAKGTSLPNINNLGGAIYFTNKTNFNINNLKINNCNSDYGGAIYINNYCIGKITDSEFTNNSASKKGGAIYSNGAESTLELENVTIKSNRATEDGGGIYFKGNLNLNGNSILISDNTAGNYGGGVYYSAGKFNYNPGTIQGNKAGIDGNDIYPNEIIETKPEEEKPQQEETKPEEEKPQQEETKPEEEKPQQEEIKPEEQKPQQENNNEEIENIDENNDIEYNDNEVIEIDKITKEAEKTEPVSIEQKVINKALPYTGTTNIIIIGTIILGISVILYLKLRKYDEIM